MAKKIATMSAQELCAALEWVDVLAGYAPDCRVVIQDERKALHAALRKGDPRHIGEVLRETRRVAIMWLGESV